jgi:NADH-quinone oxidoreductase subunit D
MAPTETAGYLVDTSDLPPFILSALKDEEGGERMLVQIGPSHPATHGTIRITCVLDHETIVECDVEPGYLHRGFEKEAENHPYFQILPYTDRLNYVSPMVNNVAFAMAVEKLCNIPVPERAQYIRVIVSEISRIADHLTCLGAATIELGAFSAGLYMLRAREYFFQLIEEICGARLTTSYTRFGGVAHDLPHGFEEELRFALKELRKTLRDVDQLLTRNRIFIDRMSDVGVMPVEKLISYGVTGPLLRAAGVPHDLRRAQPYLVYDRLDFEIPIGTRGDNYDRYMVRMEEMLQSARILEQAISQIPPGPILTEDRRYNLPPKEEVYTSIEALMDHFKIIMHGIRPPRGEVYCAVESPNGELGFYIVSDGSGNPYKCRVRPPSFINLSALREMLIGYQVADLVPTFGQINMIGGECDR